MEALKNIKILDLTRLLPGPFGTTILADLGAEVIKIESREEFDWARSLPAFFQTINRGKKSLSLNLKTDAGKEIFFRLLQKVDALAEQFRPGVMDKLGVGFEECQKHNPRLVYVSLSGYGADGPYAQKAGHDLNYISLAGISGATGTEQGELAIPAVQIADQTGGLYLVIAILAGLNYARAKQSAIKIDVSIFESALSLIAPSLSHFLAAGQEPGPAGMELTGLLANYRLYRTKDGRWLSFAPLEGKFWTNFCHAAGKPEWQLRLFAGKDEQAKLKEELAALFTTKTLSGWQDLIGKNPDLCLEPVRKFSEIEQDPQVQARKLIAALKDQQGREYKIVRSPIRFASGEQTQVKPAAEMGQNTDQILGELGYSQEEIESFKKQGAV